MESMKQIQIDTKEMQNSIESIHRRMSQCEERIGDTKERIGDLEQTNLSRVQMQIPYDACNHCVYLRCISKF